MKPLFFSIITILMFFTISCSSSNTPNPAFWLNIPNISILYKTLAGGMPNIEDYQGTKAYTYKDGKLTPLLIERVQEESLESVDIIVDSTAVIVVFRKLTIPKNYRDSVSYGETLIRFKDGDQDTIRQRFHKIDDAPNMYPPIEVDSTWYNGRLIDIPPVEKPYPRPNTYQRVSPMYVYNTKTHFHAKVGEEFTVISRTTNYVMGFGRRDVNGNEIFTEAPNGDFPVATNSEIKKFPYPAVWR